MKLYFKLHKRYIDFSILNDREIDMKKTFFLLILMTAALFTAAAETDSGLSGRDIAGSGKTVKVSGSFFEKNGEWYLNPSVSGNTVYAVHLGNEDYAESIGFSLSNGDKAEVEGFAAGSDIAACRIKTGGKEYIFRDEEGVPAWRGSGRGRNRQ